MATLNELQTIYDLEDIYTLNEILNIKEESEYINASNSNRKPHH